jgi:hypothetical protein
MSRSDVIASQRVRANARPDDRLRDAIQGGTKILDCFVACAPRNDDSLEQGPFGGTMVGNIGR